MRTVLALLILALPASSAEKVTYDDHVMPLLRNHCLNCHNSDKKKADLDASSYNGIMTGGGSGKVLAPEDPPGSLLWRLINHLEEPNMPPKGPKIPDADLAVIKKWIEGGLLENSGSKALASKKPKVDLAVKVSTSGKPDGPPPMPNGDLLLEPVLHATRAGAIAALAASPWAPLVAVAGQKQILLYHLDTLGFEGVLPFPEGFPYVLKFSRNGRLLLAGGGVGAKLGKVVLFDITTGKRVSEVGDEYDAVLAADLAPDQSRIALGGPSKLVRIYSTATGELLHTIKKHTDWVTAIAYSPDGVLLATGDRNGGAHVWEADTAQPYSDLKTSSPTLTDLAWRDDSNLIATTGGDGQIRLWELENSTRQQKWNAHGGGVQAVRFSHDGRLVSTGRDRTTKLWDGNGGQQRAFEAFGDIALTTAISHDMTKVLAGDYSGEVRVWNAADGKLLGKLDPNPPTLAERLETDSKRLVELKSNHEKLVAALAAAQLTVTAANSAVETTRKEAAMAAAAAKASEEALKAANQSHAQAVATRDNTQKDVATRQTELDSRNTALAAAQKSLSQAQGLVPPAQEALAAAETARKAAAEAWAKAKAAADASPGESKLAEAAMQAKAAADQAAATSATLQNGLAEFESKVKAGENSAKEAQSAANQAQTTLTESQKSLTDATAAVTAAEAKVKTATESHRKAGDAADTASKSVAPAETHAKTTGETLAKAKSQLDGSAQQLIALEKDLARWKAGQFNLQVIAAAETLTKQQSATEAALANAENLKAAADRAAAELAEARKALADAPGLIAQRTEDVTKAQAALDATNGAVPHLKSDFAAKQTESAAKAATLQSASEALAKVQAVLKAVQETAASAAASSASAAETANKAKAAAEANPAVSQLTEAAAKARQAAQESAAALEAARQAVTEIESQVKRATDAHAQLKTAADAASQSAKAAQQSLDQQPGVIKAAETKIASAKEGLTRAEAMRSELPKKLAALEPAAAQAAAAATAAQEMANKAAAEVPPLKQKHEQLLAEYRKLKPGTGNQ